MPKLCSLPGGTVSDIDIPWAQDQPTRIGSDVECVDRILEGKGILPVHATVVKTPHSPAYIMLDHSDGRAVTRVNGLQVSKFKIVRHRDRITLGERDFAFSEFEKCVIQDGSQYLNATCGVMKDTFSPGDEIVICRCGGASHFVCWLVAEKCSRHDCHCPHRTLLVKFLQEIFSFATVTEGSPLLSAKCNSGGYRWDKNKFEVSKSQLGRVGFCPVCKMPYHEPCWLSLTTCPTRNCGYAVREKVLPFFER